MLDNYLFRLSSILIVEPDPNLNCPYQHFKGLPTTRVASVEKALDALSQEIPDLVLISANFAPSKSLRFFESLKFVGIDQKQSLIPLVVVINLTDRLSTILGTTWGNKLGILTSVSNQNEVNSTLSRILTQ